MTEHVGLVRTAPQSLLRWWLHELGSFVPAWLKPAAARRRTMLVMDIGDAETVLHASTAEGDLEIDRSASVRADHDLGAFAALGERRYRRWPVVVRLAARLGMRKTIDLPLAARGDLDGLLRFELDRLTPFKAENVRFAWRIIDTRPADGQMTVGLDVAPKTLIDPAIEKVTSFGRLVDRVEIAGTDHQPPLNLMPEAVAPSGEKGWLGRALPLLVLALALVAAWIPFHRQQRHIEQLNLAIADIETTAEESVRMREQLDTATSEAGFLDGARNDQVGMTLLLAELTDLLPDQSYLNQLDIDGDSVKLQGLADKTSDLITIFDRSAMFASPQFRSPVTRDPKSAKERFQITVELNGRPS